MVVFSFNLCKMLFSFLNVSKPVELRLRKKKAQCLRVTKRALRVRAEYRLQRFEESMSVEDVAAGLGDCVDAVCNTLAAGYRPMNPKMKADEKKEEQVIVLPIKKKRGRVWSTWLDRSYVIFMYLHPLIFNRNVAVACDVLGVHRTTMLGWVSCSVKKNYVSSWFDLVASLT